MRHHVINAYQCVIYDKHVDMFSWSLNVSKRKVGFLIYLKDYLYLKQKQVEPLSTNPTKWSNTLKQTIRWQIADELFECVWPFCGVGA